MKYFRAFFDGLKVFMGSREDDRTPYTLEIFHLFNLPLDNTDIMDTAVMSADIVAIWCMFRKSENIAESMFCDSRKALTFAKIKIDGFDWQIQIECHEGVCAFLRACGNAISFSAFLKLFR